MVNTIYTTLHCVYSSKLPSTLTLKLRMKLYGKLATRQNISSTVKQFGLQFVVSRYCKLTWKHVLMVGLVNWHLQPLSCLPRNNDITTQHKHIFFFSLQIQQFHLNKVDMLHVRLTELHAAQQNLPQLFAPSV